MKEKTISVPRLHPVIFLYGKSNIQSVPFTMPNWAALFLVLVMCRCTPSEESHLMKLWYDKPAENWEEALPIGNGRVGAMIFGTVELEHLQINEETVWAGEPGNNLPEGFYAILPQIRELIVEGKYKEAQDLAMPRIPRHAYGNVNYGMPYQTVGDLMIDFGEKGDVNNYYRDLDIQNAISTDSI